MEQEFSSKKTGPVIKEFITINNRIRLQLKLTMEDYVLYDTIAALREAGKPLSKDILYQHTGIPQELIKGKIEKGLITKMLVEKTVGAKKIICTSDVWNEKFNTMKDFDSDESLSPGLWQIFLKRGNKQAAIVMFKKAIKVVPIELLKEKATQYIESKDGEEMKHIMHLSTWLNPMYKHWEDEIQVGKLESKKVHDGVWGA